MPSDRSNLVTSEHMYYMIAEKTTDDRHTGNELVSDLTIRLSITVMSISVMSISVISISVMSVLSCFCTGC